MTKRLWDKGEGLDSQVQRFTVGTDPVVDQQLVPFDAAASAAHARMLRSIGILDDAELKKALKELKAITALHEAGSFAIPFELEDCHTPLKTISSRRSVMSVKRFIPAVRETTRCSLLRDFF
jgi:argininosuccinate lyase